MKQKSFASVCGVIITLLAKMCKSGCLQVPNSVYQQRAAQIKQMCTHTDILIMIKLSVNACDTNLWLMFLTPCFSYLVATVSSPAVS